MKVERFSTAVAAHGEGPVWDPSWDGLRLVDMLRGDIVSLDREGWVAQRLHVGTVAAAFRPRLGGGMVVAVERGFALVDGDGSVETLPELWSDPVVRMNDGACDPEGGFLCGSMAYDMTPGAGSLHRLDPDGRVDVVLRDVTCSNGLAWSPDHTRAYYTDSTTQRIDVFDHDPDGGLVDRRALVTIPTDHGLPDGLTVDAEGSIWVAFYGGAAVRRYSADGATEAQLDLPVSQVTACTFGGADLDELYITTSNQDIPPGSQPAAGSVFVTRPGVRGLPALPYAG